MKRNFCSLSKLNGIRMGGLFVICAATAITLSAQTPETLDDVDLPSASPVFNSLYRFSGPDGLDPQGGLVQSTDGNLYGVTAGGNSYGQPGGPGTVFKITPSGALTTIYKFCSQIGCTDGEYPSALVLAADGGLYGTTACGGGAWGCTGPGGGTVFRISTSGALTTVYRFCAQNGCPDGSGPGWLVQAANGDFYGATGLSGGPATVFKITPSGKLTTLYSFVYASTDFPNPSGLVQAKGGDLYGTTAGGGQYGVGTVFKITPSGAFTTLYSFCSQSGCPDGSRPSSALVQATDGNLYGTAIIGGSNCADPGCGTIFKITPSGTFTMLYSFCSQSGCPDGSGPQLALVQATDGNLYGVTEGGGLYGHGTVYTITLRGKLTTIHSFCSEDGCTDGADPIAPLAQATSGDFYGTTGEGGNSADCSQIGCGTIFRLSVGLGPFVKPLPTERRVGKDVKILGTDLSAATNVTFNGVQATFTVVSSTEIDTTVPVGATTGKVEVFLPSGTLSSNVRFRVLP
jgi:uncharacterized repeat protein (TIGR03803 family)